MDTMKYTTQEQIDKLLSNEGEPEFLLTPLPPYPGVNLKQMIQKTIKAKPSESQPGKFEHTLSGKTYFSDSENVTYNTTLGEVRVRVNFNPDNNDKVQNLKEKFAHLYNDLLNALPDENDYSEEAIEARRCMEKSLNLLEESAMFAVKGVTA